MIEKIDTGQNQDFLEKSSSKNPNSAGPLPDSGADVSLQVNYTSFIDKATQTPQTDTMTVQQARELLLSSQAENSENIRAAAEDIIKFGI